ncbi:peptidase M16 domain protein [Pseudopedobacter saltans DSM 12145]|uniref:Peptidase M16 domain protein n=1 Tax=Pseudopedobacter saltans (strain ATCC 51119 / DSM 12145 / JCM 21818 / CCUG 39354 / LMG 10337 / NBRC 100064 / NCIMB 13643) TaxID=762903 RepID=F0SCA9_PSESL|nr:pitrilysin family protein [Pseudopedobacter saltans]ADY51706.1 peptidase M16 domain protein [Pseudopedobacter saltans DSM 12145]
MLNRKEAPLFKEVENIHFVHAEEKRLKNGIPVFILNGGEQNLVRVEFIFKNVNWDSSKPLLGSMTNSMLSEGTQNLTAAEIADKIDFYGAFFQTEFGFDRSTVTLYSLNRHLERTLPVVQDVLFNSIFPEKELNTLINTQKQRLKVSFEKNDFLAKKVFNKEVFGDTLYGYTANIDDFDKLEREDLIAYYKKAYHPQNCTVVIAGKVEDSVLTLLDELFGEWESTENFQENRFDIPRVSSKFELVEKDQALQSAIRLGIKTVNRTHPDFFGMQLLTTVLGGYFGSRLMSNIREDKGYTYGIGAANMSLEYAGTFFIASEVGADVCKNTFEEIEKEINILKTELIPEDELKLVKNYFVGSILGSLENIFSHADKFKNIYFYGLSYDHLDKQIQTIKGLTPEELRDLANKYLVFNDFVKVVVGKY